MTADNARHRLGLLAITGLSLFGALFARLWFLQVVEGDEATLRTANQATRDVIIPAPRGRILDRNGVVLVDNRPSVVLGVDLQKFNKLKKDEQAELKAALVKALNRNRAPEDQITEKFIQTRLNNQRFNQFRPIPVAEDLTSADEIYFRERAADFPTVSVEHTTVRSYPYGSLAAHLLGYVGPINEDKWKALSEENDPDKPYEQSDDIGISGVEASYEAYLRGTPGKRVYEVDRSGRVVREIESARVEPQTGNDVWLSIDAKVQYKAEEALAARVLNAQEKNPEYADGGAVALLDHTNGQVRALASYPTYNPADLVGGISEELWADLNGWTLDENGERLKDADGKVVQGPVKLFNRAIQGGYKPASTYKLASSYAAYKLGIIQPDEYIQDPGYLRLCEGDGPGCLKRNSGSKPHGDVDLRKALTVSSDVYYYLIGLETWTKARNDVLPEDALQTHMQELGYGSKTGIDLPGESAGRVPTPASEIELAEALYKQNPAAYDNDIDEARRRGRWSTGLSADLTIGQRTDATPLQTANAYASLANGGTLYQPSVLFKVTEANQPDKVVKTFEPKVIRTLDYGGALEPMRTGFRGVVQPDGYYAGTAISTFSGFPFSSMSLAGKTGTAQTGKIPGTQRDKPDNSLFVGYSEGAGSDQWVVSVIIEAGGFGGDNAAPAARMILEPIADGSLATFELPKDGVIDAEAALEDSSSIGTGGGD